MAAPQVMLVTGCSSGIGLATTKRLVRDPNQRFLVIATVISMAEKGDLVAAVGDALDKTVFIKEMDITKDEQIFTTVDDVIKQHGRIDILLNIAGIGTAGYFDTLPRSAIELTFNINTIGIIRLTQAVLPDMKRRKAGKIITVTSELGRTGLPILEIYSASKFATEGFFESIAPVARQFNISVSIVEPTTVRTNLLLGDICNAVQKTIENDSINDIDRRCARSWLHFIKHRPMLTTDEVVSKLFEVIEAETPLLRYPVPDTLRSGIKELLSDTTGEKGVAKMEELISSQDF